MSVNTTLYQENLLVETSWEVCNQLGGIYTVIRSKLPATKKKWGENYCLLGPIMSDSLDVEFEPSDNYNSSIGETVMAMRDMGYEVLYGTWLVSGRPKVVLLNPDNVFNRLDSIKNRHHDNYNVPAGKDDSLYDVAMQWCDLVFTFFKILSEKEKTKKVIFHGHEWMVCPAILDCAHNNLNVKTVFTTHATRLGRVLAVNMPGFYDRLNEIDDEAESRKYGLPGIHKLEKEGARAADVFTTVSQITAEECTALLGTKPHQVTPNGLNIERFNSHYTVHLQHDTYRMKIDDFVVGHFFNSFPFDLNKTLYFFTSGRYEHENKGFDLIIKALAELNQYMIKEKIDMTIVMFFITKADVYSINPDVLHSKALLEEIHKTCGAIERDVASNLFIEAASSTDDYVLPNLNNFVSDYWKLRYRRALHSWKTDRWPYIVTHNLVNDIDDPILNDLRKHKLFNSPIDKVKVVYHPEFISATNPLFGLEYSEFVRGCDLGVFPSYYEPWGYTPLECIARGVPAITSDLSGFGSYTADISDDPDNTGVFLLKRQGRPEHDAVVDLAKMMLHYSKTSQNHRSIQRNRLEEFSQNYDWSKLSYAYDIAFSK